MILLKYWKYIALVLAVVGLVGGAIFWYNRQIDAAYDLGVQTERVVWEKKVAEENANNRKFELILNNGIERFRQVIKQENTARVEKETKYLGTVETIIKESPLSTECRVPQEVLDARNEIRKLGPETK